MIEDFTIVCPKCERYLKPGRIGLVCRYCKLQFNHLGDQVGPMSVRNNYKPKNEYVFKANDYITLKLEHNQTYIYVKGKRFLQCIRLVLNINNESMEVYDEVGSIDEAAHVYEHTLHQNRIVGGQNARPMRNLTNTISPQQEFWGHCSNIQAWIENNYDTRILYRNMAFPLLKELMLAGDLKAKKLFKEEIALRFESGFPNVVQYLLSEGYLRYFNNDELMVLFENPKLIENAFKNRNMFYALQPFLRKIPDISKKLVKYLKDSDVENYTFRDLLQNGCLNLLNVEDWDLIFDSKKYLKSILKDQNLVVSLMKRYPQVIKKLVLRIMNNAPFKVSRMLDEIKKYERYRLSNLLKDIIEDYENKMLNPETSNFIKSKLDDLFLPNLQEADIFSLLENPQSILQKRFIRFDNRIFLIKNKVLDLRDEEIIDMRDIEHLSQHTEIKKLLLDNNHISSIRGLSKLTRLEELSLRNNKITSLRGISALVNLKVLRLEDNRITEMKGIENLTSLTELALEGNRITEIKELYKLKKLKMLNLSRNKIVKISGIEHLKQLQTLDLAFNRIIELNYSKVPYAHNIYLESNPIMRIFCQKQDIRENIVRVISFSINRFITVEFDDNIQIYVDKKLCIYLDVKGDKVYEGYNNKSKSSYYLQYLDKEKDSKIYPGFGTIELVGKLDDNQSRSKISLNKIYPFIFNEKNEEDRMIQTKFMQFCLRLQLWNECNYDPRLLQKDIAIPILRRLAILGDKDAQNVIRTEVDKKAIHTLQSIHNILDQIDFDDEDKYGIV